MARNVVLVLLVAALSLELVFMVGCGDNSSKKNVQTQTQVNITNVKVTNSNGSFILVPLRQEGPSWVGPKGEYYDKLPTDEQLRPLYGF